MILLEKLSALNDFTSRKARDLAAILLMVMLVIVIFQVFYRYILNDSFSWSEELSKTLMVWVTFLVAPWAYRLGGFVSVDMFIDSMPLSVKRFAELAIHVLIFWALSVFLAEGIEFWDRGKGMYAATVPVKLAWFYAIVPVSFFLLVLINIELIIRSLLCLVTGKAGYHLTETERL